MMERIQLDYLFEDRPTPEAAPADYDALDVVSGGSHIYGQIMWPDGGYAAPRTAIRAPPETTTWSTPCGGSAAWC